MTSITGGGMKTSFSVHNNNNNNNNIPPTPTLTKLPSDLPNTEADIVIGSPNLIQVLETYCKDWLETIQVAVSYVTSARLVPDDASVFELPLEEIYFWKKRSIYLTPLSKEANQKNGDVQWTIRVLSMISSTSGEKLREACASLRRLSVEATWNSKYLTILEKPFKALAKGPLKNVYTSIPGMVKTLKMVAASSRFYNSVERIEKLLERITLALCTHSVLETNPSFLMKHEMYELVHPNYNNSNNNNKNNGKKNNNNNDNERPIEDPFVTLTRVIETLNKWHVCISPLHTNLADKVDIEDFKTMMKNNNDYSSKNQKDDDNNKKKKKKKGKKKASENAWDELNIIRLFSHSEYIKSRCEELRDLFQKLRFYKDDYDTSSLSVNTNGDHMDVIMKRREIIHSILYTLNECTKKRVRPRIGVLPASVEYIFEPRNYSKWEKTRNEMMYFSLQLDKVSKNNSSEDRNNNNRNSSSSSSSSSKSNENAPPTYDDADTYLSKKLDQIDF